MIDSPTLTLEELEKEYILKVLNHTRWQKKRASEILGINASTLYRKLIAYGVERPGGERRRGYGRPFGGGRRLEAHRHPRSCGSHRLGPDPAVRTIHGPRRKIARRASPPKHHPTEVPRLIY